MGFFAAFFGTCRGTEIFRSLRKQSVIRTIWHMLLLVFFCALIIGVGNYFMFKYYWRNTESAFTDIFGTKITLSSKGVAPEKEPERSRRQELPFNGLLVYVSPSGPESAYPDETLKERNFIILWTPAGFSLAVRRDDLWGISDLPRGNQMELSGNNAKPMDYTDFRKRFDETVRQPGKTDWDFQENFGESVTTDRIFHFLRISCAVLNGIIHVFCSIALILASSLLFTFLFGITGAPKQMGFSWSEVWKISVYAAFPVLAVITLLPTFQLPLAAAFSWLFLIGWFIFTATIFRRLVKYPDNDRKEENKK